VSPLHPAPISRKFWRRYWDRRWSPRSKRSSRPPAGPWQQQAGQSGLPAWITSWRWRLLVATAIIGFAVFLLLPKVEIETVRQPSIPQEEAALRQPA
jgi:hypothetical protein